MGVANGTERAVSVLAFNTDIPAASPGILLQDRFNVSFFGTFGGLSATLQRSFDDGTTWINCARGGAAVTYTAALSEAWDPNPEAGVLYRVNVAAIASGTVNVRISQ
jgi:hypothetical protein